MGRIVADEKGALLLARSIASDMKKLRDVFTDLESKNSVLRKAVNDDSLRSIEEYVKTIIEGLTEYADLLHKAHLALE